MYSTYVQYVYVQYSTYVRAYSTYVTRPARINDVSTKNANFYLLSINEMFFIDAEFIGHSYAIHEKGILNSELKIII